MLKHASLLQSQLVCLYCFRSVSGFAPLSGGIGFGAGGGAGPKA